MHKKTVEYSLDKDILVFQTETELHKRQGSAVNNFEVALLPSPKILF